jgi:hypothetical protein
LAAVPAGQERGMGAGSTGSGSGTRVSPRGSGSGARDVGDAVQDSAQDAQESTTVDRLARLGIASRGLVWLVVGGLGVALLLGRSTRTDQQGALREIAKQPLGEGLLVVLAVGFAGYAASLLLSAAVGHQRSRSRTAARVESGGKALVYLALAVLVVRFLADGQQEKGDPTPSLTARLMGQPGGRWLVGLVGVVVVGAGVALAVRAFQGKHAEKIESWEVPDGRARLAVRVGTVGQAGRALVLVLVGGFVVVSALTEDPGKAKGLDGALHTLVRQPFGTVVVAVAVLGMLAYAVWSFLEAAYHRHD